MNENTVSAAEAAQVFAAGLREKGATPEDLTIAFMEILHEMCPK